jgi:hypothetical protein
LNLNVLVLWTDYPERRTRLTRRPIMDLVRIVIIKPGIACFAKMGSQAGETEYLVKN